MFDFSIIAQEWPTYLQGLGNTVWLVALSLFLGLLIAIPLGICRNSSNPLVRLPAWGYIYFFRGRHCWFSCSSSITGQANGAGSRSHGPGIGFKRPGSARCSPSC